MKFFCICILSLALIGCTSMHPDLALSQAEQRGELVEGMSLEQVIEIVGSRPSYITDTIERSSGGVLYWTPGLNSTQSSNFFTNYRLEFRDNELVGWVVHN